MRGRIALSFVALPWLSVVAGVLTGGNFVGAVTGGVVAAVASGWIAWRSGDGLAAATACAAGTAVLSVVTVVGTVVTLFYIECRDTGLDRC